MFPVDKRSVQCLWLSAPDAIPALCFALDDMPAELWRDAPDLDALADAVTPYLQRHGARRWDFIWSMERHFSEPYGPLPPAEHREWLEKLFFAHGECMIPYFGEEAKGIKSMYQDVDAALMEQAPDAASRLRFSNFTNEEYRHTFQFFSLYNAYDPALPRKIYEHEQKVFRAYMDFKTDGTWLDYGIFNMLADRLGTYQAFEWVQSSYAPLARVALKAVKDERGHGNMGYLHVRDFIEREGERGRGHVQQRIDNHFYPFHLAAFGSSSSANNRMWRKWGLKQHSNDALRAAYHAEMSLVLDSLGLKVPVFDDAYARGMEAAAKLRKVARAGDAYA
ncbi:MAG: hypothetical protein EBY24_11535 [Betaproteobacteria bacterium]|nr:hypothetical protein [Betaproteobacteria bacterium]